MIRLCNIVFVALMLLLLTPVPTAWADSYCPPKGEPFVFYPVAPVYKQMTKGYDCFFEPSRAYVDGQSRPMSENRFRPDANGLTPFEEIEGHTFVIVTAMKENASKPVSQQNFLCFLEREDGVQVLLRIPFVRKPNDSAITRGMALVLDENNSMRKGPASCTINIPACPVSQLDELRRNFGGHQVVRDNSKEADQTVLKLTRYVNDDITDGIFKSSSEMRCDSVAFTKVQGYVFMQPMAFCNLKGRKVQVPVFDFRGNGESFYGSNFVITSWFKAKAEPKAPVVSAPVKPVVEEPVKPVVEEPKKPAVEAPKKVVEEPKKPVEETAKKVVEEPAKPVVETPKKVVEEPKPVVAEPKKTTVEEPKKAEPEQKPVAADSDKERKASLTKRFGAKNAQLIMDGKVQTGFTKEMVKEALGEPDYINVTQNMYTTLEQWVYGHDKFLYFQKEKLQSVEEF